MLSRKQIKTASTIQLKKELTRPNPFPLSQNKSFVWNDYKEEIRRELGKRKVDDGKSI